MHGRCAGGEWEVHGRYMEGDGGDKKSAFYAESTCAREVMVAFYAESASARKVHGR